MNLRKTETERQQPVLLPHRPDVREPKSLPQPQHGFKPTDRPSAVWKAWMVCMMPADIRGLTPLVWGHVSPYGACDLDVEQRLDLDVLAAA